MADSGEIAEFLSMLDADDLEDRLTAIRTLSEVGDEDALRILRGRMHDVNREFGALVVGVDKLKKKLGVR